MSKINIIIPMAGAGSRFVRDGYSVAKPFIEINHRMMIELVLDGIKYYQARYMIIIQESYLEIYSKQIDLLKNKYKIDISTVKSLTQGSSCTVLSAYKNIDNNPLVICDCDNIIDNATFSSFIKDALSTKVDGSLLTFNSEKTCFSYAKTDSLGYVLDVKEKEVISENAISGFYFIKNGNDFINSCIDIMIYNKKSKNEFYISDVYKDLISKSKKVKIFNVSESLINCVGTPEQLNFYKTSKK